MVEGREKVGDANEEEIGLVERKEYEKLKRRAIRFEKNNLKYVLLLPCDGDSGWCEVCEHSALIYKYKVCLELGAPVTMSDDLDSYYIQYDIGRIRTRGYDTVRRRIQKAGLYKDEIRKDKCVIFELNTSLEKAEMTKLEEEEKTRQSAANEIMKVKFADPILHQKMINLATRLHRICFRRMDKLSSGTNGVRIVTLMDDMIRSYYRITLSGSAEERIPEWQKMELAAQDLIIELQIVSGLKLWSRENCVKLGEDVIEIKQRIEKDTKRELKKHNSLDEKV